VPGNPILLAVDQRLGEGTACHPCLARTSSPPPQDENHDDHDDRDDHHRQHELIHTHVVPEG
jgi:hypothetical protein